MKFDYEKKRLRGLHLELGLSGISVILWYGIAVNMISLHGWSWPLGFIIGTGAFGILLFGVQALFKIHAIHRERRERLRSYDVFHTPSRQPTP